MLYNVLIKVCNSMLLVYFSPSLLEPFHHPPEKLCTPGNHPLAPLLIPLPPPGLGNPSVLSVSICLFQTFQIIEIIHNGNLNRVFCDRLLSLNIMFSWFVRVVA